MKKIAFFLALLILVSASLWGINWRLNHPPLSDADKEFRSLVKGADSVGAQQMSCQQQACAANMLVKFKPLNAAQTRALIEQLRFVDGAPNSSSNVAATGVALDLSFRRDGQELARFTLSQTLNSSELSDQSKPLDFSTGKAWNRLRAQPLQLHPRFEKPLRLYLDEVWPGHLQPKIP